MNQAIFSSFLSAQFYIHIFFSFSPPTHPPTYLPIHPPTYPPTHLSTHPPTYLPTHPPIYPSTHLPTHPPTYLPIHPPTHLPIYPPTYLPTQPPTYLPTHPNINPAISPSITNPQIHQPLLPIQTTNTHSSSTPLTSKVSRSPASDGIPDILVHADEEGEAHQHHHRVPRTQSRSVHVSVFSGIFDSRNM